MNIKYIEKKMEKIIPKGVSLLEFMTFGVIVMSTYIFFSNFSLLRLNRKMIRKIIYIFSFKNIFVLTIFVLIFVVIDKIQYEIKVKYDFKYNFVQWKLLTKKFIELYFLDNKNCKTKITIVVINIAVLIIVSPYNIVTL